MPAPHAERDNRAARIERLAMLVDSVGGQAVAARIIAATGHGGQVHNIGRNLRRWLAAEPRPGATDTAPDYAIEALQSAAGKGGGWILATTDSGRRIAVHTMPPHAAVMDRGAMPALVLGAPSLSAEARAALVKSALRAMK